MNRDLSQRVAQMNDAPRCGARTRSGAPCRCPAMPNGKCRIHGGASPGAPRGAANGRLQRRLLDAAKRSKNAGLSVRS